MGRAALQARVHLAGRAVDLLTCHLKSKLLTLTDLAADREWTGGRTAGPQSRSPSDAG